MDDLADALVLEDLLREFNHWVVAGGAQHVKEEALKWRGDLDEGDLPQPP